MSETPPTATLVALPQQPPGLRFPTLVWPVAEPGTPWPGASDIEGDQVRAIDGTPIDGTPTGGAATGGAATDGTPTGGTTTGGAATVDADALASAIRVLFSARQADRIGRTKALVVAHQGRIVAERYAPGVAGTRRLISWSTAKSMLHALVGILVAEGRMDIDAPAAVPEWTGDDDPRAAITVRQLLEFRSGLEWSEDYVDGETSDVIAMLFGDGQTDTAAYAAAKPLVAAPGTTFCYSSGTSNIVSRLVRDVVAAERGIDAAADPTGAAAAYDAWAHEALFDRIGMRSARLRFDDAGTFIASSYCYATPRDYARFAYLYLRDGTWEGQRLLPDGWVDQARAPRSIDETGVGHGAHWWRWDDNPWDTFSAWGYEGQYLVVVPALDLVVVRLGVTDADLRPALRQELSVLVAAFDP